MAATQLKMSFHEVWKHLRGDGNQEGRVWGGITVSGGVLSGHPRTKLLSSGPFNREGRAKASSS